MTPALAMVQAHQLAKLSTCGRQKVGCVILDWNDVLVGQGFNYIPYQLRKMCRGSKIEPGMGSETCHTVHAEAMALMGITADKHIVKTLVITHFPCWDCIKLICLTQISEIYYYDDTLTTSQRKALDLWKSLGYEGSSLRTINMPVFKKVGVDNVEVREPQPDGST